MLDYKIISAKPTLTTENGEDYYDLLAPTIQDNISITGTLIIVNKYYVARPDLISQAMYGTDEYADIICKVNGISNPFELNEDYVIVVPSLEYCMDCIDNAIGESQLVTADTEVTQVQINKLYHKKSNEMRSPNEQIEGEQNYIIDQTNGLIFY